MDSPRLADVLQARSPSRQAHARRPRRDSRSPSALADAATSIMPPRSAVERVLDRVLDQLGEHHRQRRRGVRADRAERAGPPGPDRRPVRAHVGDQPGEPVGHLVEVDRLVEGLAQRLVDDRDRPDPSYRLLQRHPALGDVEPPRLQPQQGRDRLQVVLHPVVDLPDGRVLGDQLAVAATQVGHVAQQHQPAGVLARGAQRDRAQDHRRLRVAQLGVARHPAAEHRADRLLVGPHRRAGTSSRVTSASDLPLGRRSGRACGRPTARWGWRRRPARPRRPG